MSYYSLPNQNLIPNQQQQSNSKIHPCSYHQTGDSTHQSSFQHENNSNKNVYEDLDNLSLPPPPESSYSSPNSLKNRNQQLFNTKKQLFAGFTNNNNNEDSKDRNNNNPKSKILPIPALPPNFPLPPFDLLDHQASFNINNNLDVDQQPNVLYMNLGKKFDGLNILSDYEDGLPVKSTKDYRQQQPTSKPSPLQPNVIQNLVTKSNNNHQITKNSNKPSSVNIYDQILEPAITALPGGSCGPFSIKDSSLNRNLIQRPAQSNSTTNKRNSNNYQQQFANNKIYANLPTNKLQINPTVPSNCSLPNYLNFNNNRPSTTTKEEEVDHLTDLLVRSMENSAEPDFFGMCNKCGEKVVGEGSGCTAMEMVYHIQCFTCHVCDKELRGKPFYAMENNPHCEECYLNTLEKCSVCEKPILDRILRATGKPYHPGCFICIVCKKCLDGIPFTVDANNQVHCIDCFHGKFAPRCSVCNTPIIPEPGKTETVRVVALDKSFHVSCYKCEDCDLLLSSEVEGRGCYPLDDHILCRGCNAKRVQAITAN